MNRKHPLVWLTLPFAIAFALPIGVAGCREPGPVVPCPGIVTVTTDAGVWGDGDGGDGGSDSDEYTEPFDTPTGYSAPNCAGACRNLQTKRCPEAVTRKGEDSCYVVCQRAEATGKIDFKTVCVARATSQAAIRACGTYRCGATSGPR